MTYPFVLSVLSTYETICADSLVANVAIADACTKMDGMEQPFSEGRTMAAIAGMNALCKSNIVHALGPL